MAVITGLEVPITAPPLQKRTRGLLLDAAEPLSELISADKDVFRLGGGVRFCPVGCDLLASYASTYCPPVAVPNDDPTSEAELTFNAFNIAADIRSPIRYGEDLGQDLMNQRMSAMESSQVASELFTGAISGNAALDSSVTHLVAAATSTADLLYVFDDIMAGFENLEFMIHMSPGALELVTEQFGIDEDVGEGAGRVIRTSTGHRVIADAGYTAGGTVNDPADPPSGTVSLPANAEWVFASLPVHVWLGEKKIWGQDPGGFDLLVGHNDRTQVLERPAIVAFDPCVVIAIALTVPAYSVAVVA